MDQVILEKLVANFPGKIVRKDLTKKIKEGANVPVYVLEYLLGMYASSLDKDLVEKGVENVKNILARNYVRPDEAEKIKAKIRENGGYTVIDKISVSLNERKDQYEAVFSNLGLSGVRISDEYTKKYDRLLGGGIWCIVQMEYWFDENDQYNSPFIAKKVEPIQMPGLDIEEVKRGREAFTEEEWIDVVLRSIGMEPTQFDERVKWLHLARLIPLIENNFNFCELGPRGTGKSHVYKEISPNSILVSGGQTTVANLFYNMASRAMGLVGMWDTVAFDEVAGINVKDGDLVQIMKDYMASGSFARGKEEKIASASMVFIGNINQSVDVILKTSNLFEPFPEKMGTDSAFLDRIHCYLPGWEIPKYRPDFFTDDYGFITDYYSEVMRELRKVTYSDAIDKYFKLGGQFNQRDTIAVKKMVSGLIKIIYPHGKFHKEDVEKILKFSIEMRRRVKEQLKKIGGMEFFDVNLSYIDLEENREEYITVPEQGSGTLIPEGIEKPGHIYSVSTGNSGRIGTFKFETQMILGTGKFKATGLGSDSQSKEKADSAYKYLNANAKSISSSITTLTKDFVFNTQDLNGVGNPEAISLTTLIALCSVSLKKPVLSSMVVLGDITIGGTIIRVTNLADLMQVARDSGSKKILVPMANAADLSTVPPELMSTFNIIFYQTPEDAVFKALGVE
ncbi:protease Lon-related BREX system protein BrxL [Vagococcus fluvialis]|uniref:protease Lon-related BREX system protein BrxL n=1 Tax=Vagococcus fluvialis TaxID=2738 RepID=UPI001A8E86EE|nr:protease Lon-related BREX system protein BrxL [Vagococcus fluvialis]MBO0480616.1 protease Lon-related BREX system protein BrxL [Vagococcus fluvialis]MBO0485324.1 protease Lon-related BREX system protein BrxL [Vagococcus fluvialis]MDT2747005.1 protease Lon-related BREX system protein BrxL [Vagococcus fluvialis]